MTSKFDVLYKVMPEILKSEKLTGTQQYGLLNRLIDIK